MNAFFASDDVRLALLAGVLVASLCAAVGYFVVLRSLSFAGHAVADVGLAGGAGALVAGIDPLAGLVVFSVAAALAVGALGERARERDVATGLVLATALGLGALFLHVQTHNANAQAALLFGSIFDTDRGEVVRLSAATAGAAVALIAGFRPLLFASVAPEGARVAGVPGRALGFAFLTVMAVAVAETARVVGVLIATALLVGPAATAMTLIRRPLATVTLAIAIGALEIGVAVAFAYASFGWSAAHRGWPVSFFLTVFALAALGGAKLLRAGRS